jgi:docking protein 2
MLFSRSSQGIERLEVSDSETDKNPRIVTLENCIKVNSESSPSFLINVITKSGQIVFQCTNETELNLWTKSLQTVAFNDKLATSKRNSIVEYNDLYCSSFSEGKFTCTLISTDITVKNKLEPKIYTLELTTTEIQLRNYDDDSVIIAKWPYRYIRKYGYRDGKFTFEAGRKCDTGEGTFKLDHANPQDIFRCMSTKMKSMKKLLNGDSSSSLDCGENQLNAALSMEAGSRSPLPPSINSPNSPDVDISMSSHASLRGFLSSTDSIHLPFIPGPAPHKNTPISIPNKPPRKTLHSVNSNDRINGNFHETLVQLDSPPTPPERNKSMAMALRARDYECIENITDAWKTLGIDEVRHTEHVSTPEDELQEFAWQRSKSFNRNETRKISIVDINENTTSVSNSNVSFTNFEQASDGESDYDRLEFFPTSSNKVSSSGQYKTIVPIVPPPVKKKPQVSDDYEIITPTELQPSTSQDIKPTAEPQLASSRLADDSYLGYGVIRKTSLPQSTSSAVSFSSTSTTQTVVLSDEDLLDHHKYNGLDYAIVSKPKRV